MKFLIGIETKATYDRKTKTYSLNGLKTWIYNAPIADICLVWARCEDKKIRCFIIDQAEGLSGLAISKIPGKFSLRSSEIGMVSMKNVCVSEQNLLPNVQGIKGAMSCITNARYAVAWGVWGKNYTENYLILCLSNIEQSFTFCKKGFDTCSYSNI